MIFGIYILGLVLTYMWSSEIDPPGSPLADIIMSICWPIMWAYVLITVICERVNGDEV